MTQGFEGYGQRFVIDPFLGVFEISPTMIHTVWTILFWDCNGLDSNVWEQWTHGDIAIMVCVSDFCFPIPQLSSSDILILWSLPHANNPQRRSGPDMKYVSGSSANLDQVNVTEKVTKREKDTM